MITPVLGPNPPKYMCGGCGMLLCACDNGYRMGTLWQRWGWVPNGALYVVHERRVRR